MSELTLLMNSTDTVLLNGSAAAPVASSGAVTEGFAGVLDKRLLKGESVAAKELPPQMDEVRGVSVAEAGEVQPVDGKPLPLVAPQDEAHKPKAGNPVLDASLLSAIAQGVPAVNRQATDLSSASTPAIMVTALNSAWVGREGVVQPTLAQPVLVRSVTENSTPSTVLNTTLNPQTTAISQQNTLPTVTLPNATQDAQRATAVPVIPAMLGKPISATAQQALRQASLNAGKAHYLRADMMPAASQVVANTQHNNSLSSALTGINNPVGSTMRTDIFAAAMGRATQVEGGSELRLPTTAVAPAAPATLIATSALSDDVSNLSAGMSRLPGVSGSGLSPMLTVSTAVGQPAWASELGQRVTWLANSELREAQLQLNPRSLGAVDVRIAYGPEQQLNVSFSTTNPVARDALDASLPRLREMFEQQGLSLAGANISHESPKEREQRNSMNNESLISVDAHAADAELMDAVSLHPLSSDWLSEGMLDAYA